MIQAETTTALAETQGKPKKRVRTYTPEQRARRIEKQKEWQAKNKHLRAGYEKRWRENRPETYKAKRRRYEIRKADQIREYHRAYRDKNRDKVRATLRAYQAKNKEAISAKKREWRAANLDKLKALDKKRQSSPEYRAKRRQEQKENYDPVKRRVYAKRCYDKNKKKWLKASYAYAAKKRQRDPWWRITQIMRARISTVLRGTYKCAKGLDLIGCSREELMAHLEKQFRPGMSWSTYGVHGWHVDHVRPVKSFRLEDPEQQRACFHFSNLQPLFWYENMSKGAKWIDQMAA